MPLRAFPTAVLPVISTVDVMVEPELARGAIRASLGYTTPSEDVGTILKAWEKLANRLYKTGNDQEIAA